jgi:VIT1/CCC1 family predicted Fe2+/Mn2+ transporter
LAAFVGGAIVPILPFLFNIGNGTVVSALLSALALLVVGGFLALMSGNRPYWGALRMLFVGSAAAAVTYGLGTLIGVSVSELG